MEPEGFERKQKPREGGAPVLATGYHNQPRAACLSA